MRRHAVRAPCQAYSDRARTSVSSVTDLSQTRPSLRRSLVAATEAARATRTVRGLTFWRAYVRRGPALPDRYWVRIGGLGRTPSCSHLGAGAVRATVAVMALPISVVVALETTEELERLLERADVTAPEQRLWVLAQAQMLAHWTTVLAQEAPCYPALSAGLAAFAQSVPDRMQDC